MFECGDLHCLPPRYSSQVRKPQWKQALEPLEAGTLGLRGEGHDRTSALDPACRCDCELVGIYYWK